MAVNNKNEIVVTDFHNHSVKVSGHPPSVRASPALPLPQAPRSLTSSPSSLFPRAGNLYHVAVMPGTVRRLGTQR